MFYLSCFFIIYLHANKPPSFSQIHHLVFFIRRPKIKHNTGENKHDFLTISLILCTLGSQKFLNLIYLRSFLTKNVLNCNFIPVLRLLTIFLPINITPRSSSVPERTAQNSNRRSSRFPEIPCDRLE